jgi:hypothetical protein
MNSWSAGEANAEMRKIFPDFVRVDATRPMGEVVGAIAGAIRRNNQDRKAKRELL